MRLSSAYFLICQVRNKTSKCFCSQLLIHNSADNVPVKIALCLQLQINSTGDIAIGEVCLVCLGTGCLNGNYVGVMSIFAGSSM